MKSDCEKYVTITRDDHGFILSVIVKQTFGWNNWGKLTEAEQQPITEDIDLLETDNFSVPISGKDTWGIKRATDVVVTGVARPPKPTRQMDLSVRVGSYENRMRVFGDRYVEYHGPGHISFSHPEIFEEMVLGWTKAYGGMDPTVLPNTLDDTPMFCGEPVFEHFPGTYPRNPAGVGYFINETENIMKISPILPNQEDPDNLLTPETLFAKDARYWWRKPQPKSYGWFHTLWFPRCILAGGKPYHLPREGVQDEMYEVQRGLITKEHLAIATGSAPVLYREMTNEAAPEMILPYLNGDETIDMMGFSAEGNLSFGMPKWRPNVTAVADGNTLIHEAPRVHTLSINTEAKQFYLLTCYPFMLPDSIAIDAISKPPIDELIPRIDVTIDGKKVERDCWPPNRVDPKEM